MKSDARERPLMGGGGGTGAEMVGREAALERGAGAGSVMERRRASQARFENGRSVARQREKKRGRGGPAAGAPHGVGWRRGVGPRPCPRPAVTRTRRARAARRCSDSSALAPTWAGPGGSESGEARVARGRAWASPRRKRGGRA
jgi:hypothetical protein